MLDNASNYGSGDDSVELQVNYKTENKAVTINFRNPTSNVFKKTEDVTLPLIKRKKGHGMGLATCKKIMQLHGGELAADTSEPGYFNLSITLPLPENKQPQDSDLL